MGLRCRTCRVKRLSLRAINRHRTFVFLLELISLVMEITSWRIRASDTVPYTVPSIRFVIEITSHGL